MPQPDFVRIASNIAALNALNALEVVNRNLAIAQTRLATGRRINEAADDPAGYAIAIRFEERNEGLKVAKALVGEAKNLLATAESSVNKIKDILIQIRAKAEIGASASTGTEQREKLKSEIQQLQEEINDIANQTKWNNVVLLDGSNTIFTFQTGADKGERTSVNFLTGTGLSSLGAPALDIDYSTLSNSDATTFETLLGSVSTSIGSVGAVVGNIGAYVARLNFKEDNLAVSQANVEAAWNRIVGADMALEQVNATKFTVLQQTAVAMLAQANLSPQAILSLFR